jgi:hypothetical protein
MTQLVSTIRTPLISNQYIVAAFAIVMVITIIYANVEKHLKQKVELVLPMTKQDAAAMSTSLNERLYGENSPNRLRKIPSGHFPITI